MNANANNNDERMDVPEKVLERIKKMLRMAEDARGNPNEAANAAAMAAKLMQKYNLDAASMILGDLEGRADAGLVKEMGMRPSEWSVMPGWMVSLSISVADLFDCKVRMAWDYRQKSVNRKPYINVVFFGYKTDVQVCQWTFKYLVDQVMMYADGFQGGKLEKISFREGASNELRKRLGAMLQEKKAAEKVVASSTALVVIKQQKITEIFGEFKYSTRQGGERDYSAYNAGRAAGAKINISAPLSGGNGSAKRITA